jgi:acetyl esterase/lipase
MHFSQRGGTGMVDFDRRAFVTAGGALLVAQASAQEHRRPSELPHPAPARTLPPSWATASAVALWPGDPPGRAGFAPKPIPADSPAVFLRNVERPDLHVFLPDHPNGQGVLVIPGGSYTFVSVANEGVEPAARMTARGFTVFVLTYRLPGEGWEKRSDVPLQDAQRAMRVIRSQASRFKIDSERVSVLGFSAGGHLAATLATRHREPTYAGVDGADRLSARPCAAGLAYPVVTMRSPWTHEMSRKALLGDAPTAAEIDRRSAELHVDGATPPIFSVHAMDDEAVPVENSLRLMDALRQAKRPVEAHFFQEGGHAFGVGYPNTSSGLWVDLFCAWLERLGG